MPQTAQRGLGTMHTQHPGSMPREDHTPVDPYRLLEDDLKEVYSDMRMVSLKFNLMLFILVFVF